jgi:glycerate kinase
MIPVSQRNPFTSNSKGTGELIMEAYKKGAKDIYLGVGGSATVDFGIGALHAMGLKIYKDKKEEYLNSCIVTGGDIKDITEIDFDKKILPGSTVHLISDVNNLLLGPNGCTYVYGRQKGAKDNELPILESYMAKMADLVKIKTGKDVSNIPKVGAAGAIVAGICSCADYQLYSGIKFVADLLGLEKVVKESDAIISGEGAFDKSTLEGKTVSHVIKLAKKYNKKIIVICGVNRLDPETMKGLGIDVFDLKSRFDTDSCFKKTEECINVMFEKEIQHLLK